MPSVEGEEYSVQTTPLGNQGSRRYVCNYFFARVGAYNVYVYIKGIFPDPAPRTRTRTLVYA